MAHECPRPKDEAASLRYDGFLKAALGKLGEVGVSDLEWLWQTIVSGVTIALILAVLGWVRSKRRQRNQIACLRGIIASAYAAMVLGWESDSGGPRGDEHGRLRAIYDETARQLQEVLDHGTPDLHYAKVIEIRQALTVLVARFAAAEPLDFDAQHPTWSVYESEFFDRFDELDWLQLNLDRIRRNAFEDRWWDLPTGTRRVIRV